MPADALDQALRAAVESHVVITSQDRYSFRHALLAEAIYDDLLPGERVRLHAAYAEALRDGRGRGTAAELARHALAARDLPTALEASIRAGDEAMAVGGPEEAAHHFQQALELVVDPHAGRPASTSPRWCSRPPTRWSPPACRTARPRWSRSTSRRRPTPSPTRCGPGCTRTSPTRCRSTTTTRTGVPTSTPPGARLHRSEPTDRAPRLLAIHARVLWMNGSEEAKDAAMEALALAETHNLPRVA